MKIDPARVARSFSGCRVTIRSPDFSVGCIIKDASYRVDRMDYGDGKTIPRLMSITFTLESTGAPRRRKAKP